MGAICLHNFGYHHGESNYSDKKFDHDLNIHDGGTILVYYPRHNHVLNNTLIMITVMIPTQMNISIQLYIHISKWRSH